MARTSALRKYHELSTKMSFEALMRSERRYLMAKTAVVRVLPSRNG